MKFGAYNPTAWTRTCRGGGTNRYAYSLNDPVNLRDPTGYEAENDPNSEYAGTSPDQATRDYEAGEGGGESSKASEKASETSIDAPPQVIEDYASMRGRGNGRRGGPPLSPFESGRQVGLELQAQQLRNEILALSPNHRFVGPPSGTPLGSRDIQGLQRALQELQNAGTPAPNFLVGPTGKTFQVPDGAVRQPNYNGSNALTGTIYTGGTYNGRAVDMRVMDPVPARGNAPAYPDGYVTYQNSFGQTINPVTGQTLGRRELDSHIPIR